MNARLSTAILLAAMIPLSACGDRAASQASHPQDPQASAPLDTTVGRSVRKAMDKARSKLADENISLGGVHVNGGNRGFTIHTDDNDGRPKAEISPQGELLIEGRKVEATPAQRTLLLDYRHQVEQVASAGMDIGAAGAELGVKAAGEALRGVFTGNTDEIEQRIEAQTASIKASVTTLCGYLPAMLETQNKLAASMPEFRPYATMDQSDIDDCYEDSEQGHKQVARAPDRDAPPRQDHDGPAAEADAAAARQPEAK